LTIYLWKKLKVTLSKSAEHRDLKNCKKICVVLIRLWPWRLEMGPDPTDPTRAYFWPAVNKRPTCLRPRYFATRPEEIFFDLKGKKLKNLTFLGEIFQIQTQIINGWPDPSHKKLTRPDPGHNNLNPDPSLVWISPLCIT